MHNKYISKLVEITDDIISKDNLNRLIRSFRLFINLRIIYNRNY